ncbi:MULTISPECIES: Lrp/AsnC family transcriptional regulator [Metabacillus]|uniref:Transcriptional regulator n=1 Tax=Metabacillus indicus TaxID=246786 RepID=A0A084H122_METID|nr:MULTISPECIES: Lrp/AsnC family transcriptional regulator [Metabacillus]KEZ50423.1 transcriptional regulator [Metabacillus indicus LMG 22858]KEZ53284.1 transcriptional regulator [Metabacillus indicus]
MPDATDLKIIGELRKNGRITMKELGKKVHLTGQAASARVLKLEEEGIIEGYTIHVNDQKTGKLIHAFINVYTRNQNHKPLLEFIDKKDVSSLYKISGEGCYLIECKFHKNEDLDEFLNGLNLYANYKLSIVIKSS